MIRKVRLPLLGVAVLTVACSQEALPEADAHGGDLAAGRVIFERKCARCHNGNGDGETPVAGRFPYANLVDGVWRSDGTAESIERQIRRGRDPMPSFEKKLTDEQIRQTVEYVLDLTGGRREPRR
ncbi:MAG TPA: cytochrome c [Thermoanaerobaculia bacterium]|nr:cytochrome c [Thermoanaerobaculia bacterium]